MASDKNRKVILTDVDGVLLNFQHTISEFMAAEKNIHISDEQWNKSYWLHEILESEPEKDKDIFVELMHSDYFRRVPAKECAKRTLQNLAKDGWRFIAITAAGQGHPDQNMHKVRQNRMDNLETHFGNIFDDLHIMNFFDCKRDFLRLYDPTWWVEDSVTNALVGHEVGHRSVIMETRYYKPERNTANLPVVKSWDEIQTMIDEWANTGMPKTA